MGPSVVLGVKRWISKSFSHCFFCRRNGSGSWAYPVRAPDTTSSPWRAVVLPSCPVRHQLPSLAQWGHLFLWIALGGGLLIPHKLPQGFFSVGVEGFQLQWPGWGTRPQSWRPPAMASRAPSSTMASKLSVLSWRPRPVSLSVSVLSHSRALPLPCGTVTELCLSCVVCFPPRVSLYGYFPVLVKFDYDFIQLYFINYLVSSCVFKFLSVQLSLVWSTHYIRCSSVSTLPCLALPCLY